MARHHESEWNKLGKWTGLVDVHLTPYGVESAEKMGALIKEIKIDKAFSSKLLRAQETLAAMLKVMGQENVPTEFAAEINERDYGDYTGKNKWELKELIGEEKFNEIRRSWDCPLPKGESLKMVAARSIPYYQEHILPALNDNANVLVVAHGNSIRSIMKYIEDISDEKIKDTEMPFGAVIIYSVDEKGKLINKEVRQVESKVNA